MNDYTRGVVGALLWVRYIMKENAEDPEALEKIQSEITTILKLIGNNIAVDFPEKFKLAAATH